MPDETMSATFDDYRPNDGAAVSEAPPAEPVAQPPSQAAAPAPATEKTAQPRDEQGKFVAQPKQEEPKSEPASTPAAPDIEAQARAQGWKPLEEFGGDPRKWVEARVWVENAPLVAQVKAHKQKIREQNRALEAAQQHYARVHEVAYNKALQDLAEQKRQAVMEQDVAKVEQLDMERARIEVERMKAPAPTVTVDPSYQEWIDANPTIVGDPQLKSFAIAYEQTLLTTEPDIDKRLEATTQAVRAAFPDRFKNGRRQQPPVVEGSQTSVSPNGNGSKKFGVSDLSADERTVMNRLVSSGVLTAEQYIKDIQEARNGTYSLNIN